MKMPIPTPDLIKMLQESGCDKLPFKPVFCLAILMYEYFEENYQKEN
jgi:hypothetical protein